LTAVLLPWLNLLASIDPLKKSFAIRLCGFVRIWGGGTGTNLFAEPALYMGFD
jgi:hypothetical protein